MDNIKINLTITLPGSVLVSKEESLKNPKQTTEKTEMELFYRGKKERLQIFTRKAKPAKQVINLTQEAYDNFISDNIPHKFKGVWKGLSDKDKIRWWCQNIASSLGGTVGGFEIFD